MCNENNCEAWPNVLTLEEIKERLIELASQPVDV